MEDKPYTLYLPETLAKKTFTMIALSDLEKALSAYFSVPITMTGVPRGAAAVGLTTFIVRAETAADIAEGREIGAMMDGREFEGASVELSPVSISQLLGYMHPFTDGVPPGKMCILLDQ